MKEQDLKTLKELSREAEMAFPGGISVDGAGAFHYKNGNPVGKYEILQSIESAYIKIKELNAVIQNLKGRKVPGGK